LIKLVVLSSPTTPRLADRTVKVSRPALATLGACCSIICRPENNREKAMLSLAFMTKTILLLVIGVRGQYGFWGIKTDGIDITL